MPSLIVERGQEKGFSFGLTPDAPTVVGRDPANEVIISDPASSRRHFQIRFDDGRWRVADLGSRNSTYVNEERLEEEIALEYGDRIQVGETVFSFLEEEKTKLGKAAGLAGKDIGGYKILDRIGRGGMGTVYKARQISLNRIVALKVLSSKYASDGEFVEQFVAEARSAGQLNHPNVVQVFDVGQSGGLHFFSMEFMDGGSVQDMLAQQEDGRLHWTEALPIVQDAARGLVFAEKRGIVHRDIKPDNLMLTSEGKAKIGDLGLAMKADEAKSGKIFGTPHFIAPEQARGLEVSHTADIYSLGASFYRICAGMTPFQGTTVKEILRKQINDPHTPLVELIEDFPPDLSAILDRMMAKGVEDRYRSATELVEDLEKFHLDHQIELAGGIRKSNKFVLFGGGIAIVTLGIVAAVLANQEPEVINNTTERIVEVRTGTTGPVLTPDAIRRQKLLAAKSAMLELRLENPTGEVDLARKDAWLAKADSFAALAKDHPDGGEFARAARERARDIRESLKTKEAEHEKTIGAATAWWTKEKAALDENLAAADWSAVLRAARRLPNDPIAKKHMQFVPEAKTYIAGLEKDVLARARKALDDAVAGAQARLDGGDPGGALQALTQWAADLHRHDAAHEEFPKLAQQAEDWVADRKDALVEQLDADRAADRLVYATAYRGVRHLPASEEDGCPVFEFRFADAADQLAADTASIRTWLYRERVAAKVARLRAMQTAWAAFVAQVGDGSLIGATDALPAVPNVAKGSIATLDLTRPVTLDGLRLTISIPGVRGSAGRSLHWADLSREQIWTNFLDGRVDRVAPDLALGLSWVFAEVGHGAAAQALLDRAIEGGVGNGAGFPADVERDLKREIAAIQAYEAIVASGDAEPQQVMRAVETWRQQHYRSDLFLLVDGRAPARLPDLFSPVELQEFLDSLGRPR